MICYFFFNDTATTEIYTLSLHDALPISRGHRERPGRGPLREGGGGRRGQRPARRGGHREDGVLAPAQDARERRDRKSTRLNSSHANISYAVFCLKKKKTK